MMKFEYSVGATPLDPDEAEGLIPLHITTHDQLNEWEQANIVDAEIWAFSTKHRNILTIDFLKHVHHKMFDKTWRWAGKFRKTNKNIGVDSAILVEELKKLLDDVNCQITHHSYSIDEIAYRFHHRLVSIHPFPNGNGRHARMVTDILLVQLLSQPRFSWGSKNLLTANNLERKQYIKALKDADKHDYTGLSVFVRS